MRPSFVFDRRSVPAKISLEPMRHRAQKYPLKCRKFGFFREVPMVIHRSPLCFSLVFGAGLAGCALADGTDAVADDAIGSSADALSLASSQASLNGLTLSFSSGLNLVRNEQGQTAWELWGSSNKDLERFFTFVPDDAYATPTLVNPRRFTVRFDVNELHTMLTGIPLFAAVKVAGDRRDYYAAIWLTQSYGHFYGSTMAFVDSSTQTVFYGGQDWYRGMLSTKVSKPDLAVYTSNDGGAYVEKTRAREYSFWFHWDNLINAAQMPAGDQVTFAVVDDAQWVYRKHADVVVRLAKVAMSDADPQGLHSAWPPQGCKASVQGCLDRLRFGSFDASSCGTFDEVRRCKVTKVLPMLLPGIPGGAWQERVAKANGILGPREHVMAFGYAYHWAAGGGVSMDQALEALIQFERIPGATRVGQIERAQVEDALGAKSLDGFVQALCVENHEVGCDPNDTSVATSLRFGKANLAAPYAMPWSSGNARLYLVLLPNTGRMLAIETAEQR